jgi:DNA-binding NtrC family response regulator
MKHRILVVDDDQSARDSVKKVLEQAGFAVAALTDAPHALAELELGGADLVLLDLDLPDDGGWEVLDRVTRRSPTIPVIIIGHPEPNFAKEIAYAALLLEKPLDPAVLLSAVQQSLSEPREVRLRRCCAYLESSRSIPVPSASYLRRMPVYRSRGDAINLQAAPKPNTTS